MGEKDAAWKVTLLTSTLSPTNAITVCIGGGGASKVWVGDAALAATPTTPTLTSTDAITTCVQSVRAKFDYNVIYL